VYEVSNWHVLQRQTIKADRFEVVVERVQLPNQSEAPFSYVKMKQGVCVIPILENDQVICIKQYRHIFEKWEYELPAGGIEEGDIPIETAKKELLEETGYTAAQWMDLGYIYGSVGSTDEVIHLFAAKGLNKYQQELEESEEIEIEIIDLEELKKWIAEGEFRHSAGIAAVARYVFRSHEA
jgi:ADP-ribose pyrophosphatase